MDECVRETASVVTIRTDKRRESVRLAFLIDTSLSSTLLTYYFALDSASPVCFTVPVPLVSLAPEFQGHQNPPTSSPGSASVFISGVSHGFPGWPKELRNEYVYATY